MNSNDLRFEIIRRCRDGEASAEEFAQLESNLREDIDFREAYVRYTNLDVALSTVASSTSSKAVTIPVTARAAVPSRRSAWLSWRPLSAAAAGIVFGMFCTSMVFGFVAQRLAVSKKVPLAVYEPGIENSDIILHDGLPDRVGQWGADSAMVVTAENGAQPLEGKRMLRLDPIPIEKNVKNDTSRVYQVLDLGSLPKSGIVDDVEVQVTASFSAANTDVKSRYMIRAFALNETPEQATRGFWPKSEDDGVVSVSQRFETLPGDRGWYTFSLKMPLPRGAQSLVFILGSVPLDDESVKSSPHYVDDVHVSVLTSQSMLP